MRRIFFLFTLLIAQPVFALPQTISSPKAIGSAEFSLLGVPLYLARLYTENGTGYAANQPFILELTYHRNISKSRLIEATTSEMKRMSGSTGGVDAQLSTCFRDVNKGDKFAAVNRGVGAVDIYFNNAKTCTLSGRGISKRFFDIWLSDASRAPALSQALRGEK